MIFYEDLEVNPLLNGKPTQLKKERRNVIKARSFT